MDVIVFVGAVTGGILIHLVASELLAWGPRLSEWLMRLAVLRLAPGAMQERMCEEWAAHLQAIPPGLWRIATAAGFLIAAMRFRMVKWFEPKAVVHFRLSPRAVKFLKEVLEKIPDDEVLNPTNTGKIFREVFDKFRDLPGEVTATAYQETFKDRFWTNLSRLVDRRAIWSDLGEDGYIGRMGGAASPAPARDIW
jgi:hypothetical protein